ncbi:hypothetical protein H6P81_002491 [Aristolochia fimbriata]|uniref:RING-type E3 ubiquitin transferase n=1 Tax=Aristolochia fimbriata TaxID=158543 RepID=A0AAV7FEG7_ARIFI|nr:hypothetical protein H6P81_002491 [Aristolochia fimbriata]
MGQSASHRRRQDQQSQNYPPQLISSPSAPPLLTPPPPSQPATPPPPPPPNYVFAANAPYPTPRYPFPVPPSQFCSQYPSTYGSAYRYGAPAAPQFNYPYYGTQTGNGWVQFRPSSSSPWPPVPPQPPAPYVEHNRATKVKNVINVRKETIRMEVDEDNPDCHLVSFSFDAVVDGSITIYYFAREGENCSFSPLYLDIAPVSVPFQKGSGQKFHQPSGTGIDLGFFALDQLSRPFEEDAYPLVISARAQIADNEQFNEPHPNSGSAQITQAVLEKRNDEYFEVKVVKQILWVDGVRYELREIFGIGNSTEEEFDDDGSGKECVICMSEPKDTAVLPCRHMCMCSECAKVLRLQSNKCPICRQPVEQLIEIKVKKDEQPERAMCIYSKPMLDVLVLLNLDTCVFLILLPNGKQPCQNQNWELRQATEQLLRIGNVREGGRQMFQGIKTLVRKEEDTTRLRNIVAVFRHKSAVKKATTTDITPCRH